MPIKTAERREDMSPTGMLRLHLADDGDIIVAVDADSGTAFVEFCNGGHAGGQSPRTHTALLALFEAIKQDNQDPAHQRCRGQRGVGVDTD